MKNMEEDNQEDWLKFVMVSIAIVALLTAVTAYVSSDLSDKGRDDLNEATRWAIFAANAYSSSWTEGSLGHFAQRMADNWNEIASITGEETDRILAQNWQKLADEKRNRSKQRFDLFTEKIEEGLEPLRESGRDKLEKASKFTLSIVLFQIASTTLVASQVTKKKILFVLSWGLIIVGVAYILPVFI